MLISCHFVTWLKGVTMIGGGEEKKGEINVTMEAKGLLHYPGGKAKLISGRAIS